MKSSVSNVLYLQMKMNAKQSVTPVKVKPVKRVVSISMVAIFVVRNIWTTKHAFEVYLLKSNSNSDKLSGV